MAKLMLLVAVAFISVAAIVIIVSYYRFNRQIDGEIAELALQARPHRTGTVTEDMLAGLPEPVQRYLRRSGVVGKPVPTIVHLRQTGRIRKDDKSAWMNIEAVEYYSTNPPAFVWKAQVPIFGLPVVIGRDRYGSGEGSILMKALSLVTIADAKGPEVNQGALMRYLNEMSWFPAAFLGDNVTWRSIDDSSAEVTLVDNGMTATAVMHFDDVGRLENFVAKRHRSLNKGYSLETWSTPMSAYGVFGGVEVPVRGRGVWNLTDGDLEYVDLTIHELNHDQPR